MFQGETAITIDDKGRMAVPTAHRDVVARECGNQLVLTYNPFESGSLYIYPQAIWERVRDQVNKLPKAKRVNRNLQLKLVGAATFVELDGNGRITIPASHRRRSGSRRRPCCWAWATSSNCGASRRTTRRSVRRCPTTT